MKIFPGMFNLPGANRSQVAPTLIGAPPVAFPSFGSFPPPGAPGSSSAPNLARQSRRLYVGNITYEANEQNLHSFFSQKMIELGIGTGTPGDPILAVQVNHEKSYAFVEVSFIKTNISSEILNQPPFSNSSEAQRMLPPLWHLMV